MEASASAVGHSASWPLRKMNAFLAISVGGLNAGTLDLTQAGMHSLRMENSLRDCHRFARLASYSRRCRHLCSGVALHFFIACSAAAVYTSPAEGCGL